MHRLICGTTMSGKTTLAREMARQYARAKVPVVVLDELVDPGWVEAGARHVTDSPEEFLEIFWNGRNYAVFIDEAGDSVGRYDAAMARTATRGRHWGHRVHYITQRPSQLARTVRAQCAEVYAFALEKGDAETLAAEYLQDALLECPRLAQGEYVHAIRFGRDRKPQATRGKIF